MAKKSNKVLLIGYIKPWGGAQGEISAVFHTTCNSADEAREIAVPKIQSHHWCKFEIKYTLL
jgi:hypothetical protein